MKKIVSLVVVNLKKTIKIYYEQVYDSDFRNLSEEKFLLKFNLIKLIRSNKKTLIISKLL